MNLDQTQSVVRVSAEAVHRVLPFVSKGDVRFYLRGVSVQPVEEGGVIAVATDGHILLAMRDLSGRANKPVILPFGDGPAPGALRKANNNVHVSDDGLVWIADEHGIPVHLSTERLIEGKFPDVARITGQEWLAGPSADTFRLDLLQRIAKVGGKRGGPGVRFFHQSNAPASSPFTIGRDCFGVIMPMMDVQPMETLASAVPAAWLKVPEAEAVTS